MALTMVSSRFEATQKTYKVIFIDLEIPGEDSGRTAKKIKHYLSDAGSVVPQPAIVFTSNHLETEDTYEMHQVMQKPIFKQQL